jgi:uncharacterized protein (UPF0262 family)
VFRINEGGRSTKLLDFRYNVLRNSPQGLNIAASPDVYTPALTAVPATRFLIEQNLFAPEGADGKGPFTLHIGITGSRLMFDIRREDGTPVVAHLLSLTPFRRIVKDYFMICDSYYQAIRTATPDKIEAIDMGRRGIHDEGSRTLQERLKGKVRVDFETSRRLFTLITVLHWKG